MQQFVATGTDARLCQQTWTECDFDTQAGVARNVHQFTFLKANLFDSFVIVFYILYY